MNHIDKLTRLNVELEGLLHVLAKRDTADLRKLLGEKYDEFNTLFKELMANGETADAATEDALERADAVLTSDEVKDQEAVSDEVESETEAADEAISHEVQEESFTASSLDMPGEEQAAPTVAEEEKEPVSPLAQPDEEEDWSMMDTAEIVSVTVDDEPTDEVSETETPKVETELNEIEEMPSADDDIRVDEMLTRRGAEDLKRVFTLNDKFRFRRELFHQNDDLFRDALARLESFSSYEEARQYIISDFETEENKDSVADFLNIIKPHYC